MAYTNNSLGNIAYENFLVTTATAAVDRKLSITNSDNSNAASHAHLQLTTGGATGGNPYINWYIDTAGVISMGLANASSDTLIMTNGVDLASGSSIWTMTQAGERNMPLQPSFYAYCSNQQDDVTGDGTAWDDYFEAELWDQNNDYTVATGGANGYFTAPVTGRYFFKTGIKFINMGTLDVLVELVTSNRTYVLKQDYSHRNSANIQLITCFGYADMDAADTAYTQYTLTGGSKTVDVAASIDSCFAGELSV